MRRSLLTAMAIGAGIFLPLQVFADAPGITDQDVHSVQNTTEYYDTASNPACNGTRGGGSGTIGAGVGKGMTASAQQKFQQIMVAAGQKFNVDPNFIAAFYYAENAPTGDSTNNGDSASPPPQTGDGKWREPAPPYGSGSPYPPPNGFSATGPFQFINSTWATYGEDGNGDGSKDVNDLTDAAFGASHLLSAAGAKVGSNDAVLKAAAETYNHSSVYAQSVLNTFHYVTNGGQAAVSGGSCPGVGSTTGYKFPFRDVHNLSGKRVDEGIDYGGDGPVYAIGTGKLNFATSSAGWPGGNFISYKLTDPGGAANGKNVYVAENCTINPAIMSNPNLTADTVLCTMHDSFPFIETGWADADPTAGNLAAAHVEYAGHDGYPTEYGVNFGQFMQSLGDTTSHEHQHPQVIGTLPAGWPVWH